MNSERLWIVILAVVSFLAGLAGGVLAARHLAPVPEAGTDSAYVRRFVEHFDLDAARTRDLAFVLEDYAKRVEDLKARHAADLEPELVEAGETCRERIRIYVLPPDRVAEFDRMELGTPYDVARAAQ